ncbi:MAG: M23 family metallopeptidase [Clostridia bacterium]|nr:M23 family metallopeptidase [Clostridia bacterium]
MNNNKFYKIGAVISIVLIGLVVTFIVLAQKRDNKTAQTEENSPSVMSSSNIVENEEIAVEENEFQEIAASETNTTKAENTNKASENKTTENKATENKTTQNKEKTSTSKNTTTEKATNTQNVEKTEEKKNVDPVFCYPVEGEVTMEYAKDKLVYSNTLGEWITHLGVDIKADKTTVVKASADGTIKSIKNDPRYGLTVVIEHNNGFSTVYSNLLTAEFVKVGEKVTSGQTIGTVGNTASFEILDESHLHFEILKDNEQIDPNMYLKK